MRTISVNKIKEAVKEMCMEASFFLPEDVRASLESMRQEEPWPLAKETLKRILDNADIAENQQVPMCQDTGMTVIFATIGQEVHFEGGSFEEAIQEGVRQGYKEGYLRKSVVKDPLFHRENTQDNTPAIIHYNIVPGEICHILLTEKGFGSENMSRTAMLKPSDGVQGVVDFVIETVQIAGSNPCPPIVVGVGIGGTLEKACLLAKKALMRPLGQKHEKKEYAGLEKELLEKINALGIGPQGFGGKTTALDVFIEVFPTHIAGLPVAVNINCHATRHKERNL